MNRKYIIWIAFILVLILVIIYFARLSQPKKTIGANTEETKIESLSNTKIGFGIKRADNHEQPDIGTKNKTILNNYNALYMGNKEKKYIYLTFDLGYEAGYTEKILEVLKQNEVSAVFFITAHYLNTQPDLVKRMIDEGHIVGNHTPNCLMPRYIV